MTPKTVSLIAFAILVGALVGLIFRHAIVATHPVGLAVQGAAVLLMIWARMTLKWRSFQPGANPTQGELITSGPYHWIRHPIYAAIFYFLVAGVVFHLSPINVALAVIALFGIGIRVVAEERMLLRTYDEYANYITRTKRIIPFVL